MKKTLNILIFSATLLTSMNASAGWKEWKGAISCVVATGLSFGLVKENPAKVAGAVCGGLLSYDLVNNLTDTDHEDIDHRVREAMKTTQDMIVKNHEETKKRYALYRKVIKRAVIKRFNQLEKKLMEKTKGLNAKRVKRQIERDVSRELDMKLTQALGVKSRDMKEDLKKEAQGLIPDIVDQVVNKLIQTQKMVNQLEDKVKDGQEASEMPLN